MKNALFGVTRRIAKRCPAGPRTKEKRKKILHETGSDSPPKVLMAWYNGIAEWSPNRSNLLVPCSFPWAGH